MAESNPINYKKIQDELKGVFGETGLLDKETLAEAADDLAVALREKAIIQYDIVTGYYRIATEPGGEFNECSEKDAQGFFNIVVVPLIRIILTLLTDGGHRTRKLSNSEAKDLWEVVKKTNIVDSRREEYDAIPAWDGKPRLETFMRDYFDSDSMPILFKLLMTCIMAKWRSPTCHVKYFFDLVGDARGTGKTTLFEHLLGKRALIVPVASRPEDMFVTAYSNGALVVIDDECSWVNQKKMGHMTYDQFKSMVTTQRDVFSRKFGQPEVHERAFVIVRTSNEPRTSFAANERRQIILNVGLPERVCKHWSMPEGDKQQLLAEAKDYVEKHDGQPYQLTPEEEDAITEANLNNFDTESEWYESIMRFLRAVQNKPSETTVYQTPKGNGKIYIRYINYVDWCKDQHIKYVDDSRTFSRQLFAIAKIQPRLVKYDRAKIKFPTIGTTRAAEVLRKQEEDDESLCESPF